jgi:hypothetical protein
MTALYFEQPTLSRAYTIGQFKMQRKRVALARATRRNFINPDSNTVPGNLFEHLSDLIVGLLAVKVKA